MTQPPTSGSAATEQLIDRLAIGLPPVRRIAPSWARAGVWLALVAVFAIVLASRADLPAVRARLMSYPDMWLAVVGSVATALLGAFAAMQLSLPDRSWRWSLLPLPAAALWLGASGLGCLRQEFVAAVRPATMQDAMQDCMPFILKTSLILAIPLAVLLWRARPLRPELVATTAGLATAAAAASLLWFEHPFDASATDLVVHIVAVLLVVLACRVAVSMRRLLSRR